MKIITLCLLAFICLVTLIEANTEILVFDATQLQALPVAAKKDSNSESHVLDIARPLSLSVTYDANASSSSVETWATIKLDSLSHSAERPMSSIHSTLQFVAGTKYMIRLSWPASVPADVKLDLFRSDQDYLPILRVNMHRGAVVHAQPTLASKVILPYDIILEPVYLGFIPRSSVGLLCMLVVLVAGTVLLRLPQYVYNLFIEDRAGHQHSKRMN